MNKFRLFKEFITLVFIMSVWIFMLIFFNI